LYSTQKLSTRNKIAFLALMRLTNLSSTTARDAGEVGFNLIDDPASAVLFA
jgi:hypothetical protein